MNCGVIIALVYLFIKHDFPVYKYMIVSSLSKFIGFVKKKEHIKEIINFFVYSILNERHFVYLKHFEFQWKFGMLFESKIMIYDDDFKTEIVQFIIDLGCIPKLIELIR